MLSFSKNTDESLKTVSSINLDCLITGHAAFQRQMKTLSGGVCALPSEKVAKQVGRLRGPPFPIPVAFWAFKYTVVFFLLKQVELG